MSNILILNQPQVQVGLTTETYTVTSAGLYSVKVQATVPSAVAPDSGAGSGVGLGAGTGGGGTGFTGGGLGLGNGGVGQGFGPSNGYQQPPASGSNVVNNYPAVTSSLVIVVNQNGSPVYTAPALTPTEGALQFKTQPIVCAPTDVITVVFTSSNANDLQLNSLKSTVTIQQGA